MQLALATETAEKDAEDITGKNKGEVVNVVDQKPPSFDKGRENPPTCYRCNGKHLYHRPVASKKWNAVHVSRAT